MSHLKRTNSCYQFKILVVELTESKCTMNGYVYDSQFSVCYKADTRLANNSYAHQLCSQTGGRLMVIDSQRKQEFIGNITFPTGREYQLYFDIYSFLKSLFNYQLARNQFDNFHFSWCQQFSYRRIPVTGHLEVCGWKGNNFVLLGRW